MTNADIAAIIAAGVAGGVTLILAVLAALVLWQNRKLMDATMHMADIVSSVHEMVAAAVQEAGAVAEQAKAATEAIQVMLREREQRREHLPPERARQFTAQMHVLDEVTRIVREPVYMAAAVAFHEDEIARLEAQSDATTYFRRRGVVLPDNADAEASPQRLTLRVDSPASLGAVRASVWYDIAGGWGWSVSALPGRPTPFDPRSVPPRYAGDGPPGASVNGSGTPAAEMAL